MKVAGRVGPRTSPSTGDGRRCYTWVTVESHPIY